MEIISIRLLLLDKIIPHAMFVVPQLGVADAVAENHNVLQKKHFIWGFYIFNV